MYMHHDSLSQLCIMCHHNAAYAMIMQDGICAWNVVGEEIDRFKLHGSLNCSSSSQTARTSDHQLKYTSKGRGVAVF